MVAIPIARRLISFFLLWPHHSLQIEECFEFLLGEHGFRDLADGAPGLGGLWRSAAAQGQLAGENMAGAGKPYLRSRDDYFWRLFGPPLRDRFHPR